MKKCPSKVTWIVQSHGSSIVGANSKKFGVLTNIVLDNLSKLPRTSLEIPPNKNLTLNFCIPLNAVPNIDKIVFTALLRVAHRDEG